MKQIPLHHLTWYLTATEGLTWRQKDWNARAIIRIVKQEAFRGELRVKIDGQLRTFNDQNGQTFVPVLCRRLAEELGRTVSGNFSLVPLPNSDAIVGSSAPFRTLEIAQSIAKLIGPRVEVVPALRWSSKKAKAHKEGGGRNPYRLYEKLVVLEKPRAQIVLFDDVKTTGSQLIAAYRKLRDANLPPVAACVIGHVTLEQHEQMLGWTTTSLTVEEDDPFEF
jgi:hypothetical protein